MPDTAQRRLGEYSKGMRQKVGIIRAMLHDPAVLLLDEPTSAMDPHSAKLVRDAVLELRNDRRAIIVCTHNLAEAELLADRIAIISEGTMRRRRRFEIRLDTSANGFQGDLDDLITVEDVQGDTICYLTDDPQVANPQLVRRLDGQGLGVVELREISATLEEVYLDIVGDAVR